MPSTSPHLVEVGEGPSITMSFTYYTDSTRRDNLVHKVRGRMAEFGVNIPASWHSGRFDQTLYWGAMAARAAARMGYQATGRKIGQEHARYARAES